MHSMTDHHVHEFALSSSPSSTSLVSNGHFDRRRFRSLREAEISNTDFRCRLFLHRFLSGAGSQ